MSRAQRLVASALTLAVLVLTMALSVLADPVAAASRDVNSTGGTSLVPLLIKFRANTTAADASSIIRANGGTLGRDLTQIRTKVIYVPEGARDRILAAYSASSQVERASAAVTMTRAGTPSDPDYTEQWALAHIDWANAFAARTIGGAATLAVLDTGVDASHPEFAGKTITGISYTGGDALTDPNGHGTALASIAAANTDDGTGIAGVAFAGVGSLQSVQVLGADGSGTDADIVAGVLWAADHGASVILMGFSSPDYSYSLADAVAYAWSQGAVLVAATGNGGTSAYTYPAGMPYVVGVAATDQSDGVTSYSSTGSALVTAPGDSVLAAQAGGGYAATSGTSAAAAHAAGLALLLRASGFTNSEAASKLQTGANAKLIDVDASFDADGSLPAPAGHPASGVTDPTYTAANKNLQILFVGTGTGSVTLSVTSNTTPAPSPNPCTATCVVTLNNNAAGTVTATPASGSVFVQFTGDVTACSANHCDFNMSGSNGNPAQTITVDFNGLTATTTTFVSGSGTYGGTGTFTATLKAGPTGIAGKTVSFSATTDGKTITASAITDATGVATTSATSLCPSGGCIGAGTYPGTVTAIFGGDSSYAASSGTGGLTITPKAASVSAVDSSKIYGAADPSLATTSSGFLAADLGVGKITFSAARATGENVGTYTITPSASDAGTGLLGNYTITDNTATFTITPKAASVSAVDKTRNEGNPNPELTVTYSGFKNGETLATSGVSGAPSCTATVASEQDGTYPIICTEGTLSAANYTFAFVNGTLTVINVTPTITSVTGPLAPVAANTAVTVTATFTDPGPNDVHRCTFTWDADAAAASTDPSFTASGTGNGSCAATHTYVSAGVYTVTVVVEDEHSGVSQDFKYVVVYDPNAGFVTGGGWIMSPAGACTYGPVCSGATGRANFGFVSKYLKGASTPSGNTEFNFSAGNFNFSSTSYQWLVVQGSSLAQYKGSGTINGTGGYSFLLTAYDGGNTGDGFRIKITDASGNVVYDNKRASSDDITQANTQLISGGSIVVHK